MVKQDEIQMNSFANHRGTYAHQSNQAVPRNKYFSRNNPPSSGIAGSPHYKLIEQGQVSRRNVHPKHHQNFLFDENKVKDSVGKMQQHNQLLQQQHQQQLQQYQQTQYMHGMHTPLVGTKSFKSRQPLSDITNNLPITPVSQMKQVDPSIPKETRFFTYLTFVDKDAKKQFKVCLYVDKELNIPFEYVHKLQDHAIDNDVATDDEQIKSASRKLKNAIEEEIYLQRPLEEDILEEVMYEQIELWESEEHSRRERERQQSIIEFELLRRNQRVTENKRSPLDELYERIFLRYQQRTKRPYTLASHERFFLKTIEKTLPKFRDSFKAQGASYKSFLSRRIIRAREKAALEAAQAQELAHINSSNDISQVDLQEDAPNQLIDLDEMCSEVSSLHSNSVGSVEFL